MEISQEIIQDELYIYSDVFDKTKSVYAYPCYNLPQFLPNKYVIACENLPIGFYRISNKNVDFMPEQFSIADIEKSDIKVKRCENGDLTFVVTNPKNKFRLQARKCRNIEMLVQGLRRLVVLNSGIEHKTLLQKDIEDRLHFRFKTDFGNTYNADSLLDTVDECLELDETIELDDSKDIANPYVRYLQTMKLHQDKKRFAVKQEALEKERLDIEARQNRLSGK